MANERLGHEIGQLFDEVDLHHEIDRWRFGVPPARQSARGWRTAVAVGALGAAVVLAGIALHGPLPPGPGTSPTARASESAATSATAQGSAAPSTRPSVGPTSGPVLSPPAPSSPSATGAVPPAMLALDSIVATGGKTDRSGGGGSGPITSSTLTSGHGGDLVVAYVGAHGPSQSAGVAQEVTALSGLGLTWQLVARENASVGTAEVWDAMAATPVAGTVSATMAQPAYAGFITVVAVNGADLAKQIGTVATANGSGSSASATVVPTRAGSWVWTVGSVVVMNAQLSMTVTAGSQQSMIDQDVAGVFTGWVQQFRGTVMPPAAVVSSDSFNHSGPWNLVAVEIRAG